MTVKFEIKDQLARLLAQEDLIVEHKNCETAQFNVETRVLTLPNWNRASEVVYDLLVGHEVGHALYTPNEDFSHVKAPKSYLNVTEDARIEKLMKRRFPGLAKSFFRGYTELNENDFFGIEGEDPDKFSFIDRINLYFKGNLDMKFSDEEKPFIDIVSSLETFADACLAAEQIYAFTQEKKKEKEDIPTPEMIQFQSEGSSGGDGSPIEGSGDSEWMDDAAEEGEEGQENGPGAGISGGDTFEEGFTDENLQEKIEQLCGYSYGDSIYLEVPDVKLHHLVVSSQRIWNYFEERNTERVEDCKDRGYDPDQYYVDEYNSFKKSAQKEVNYLVKEFEMKKSASAYARAATSRTGVLNTGLLHTYKFNEDLFKKVTVLPDGKNHGLIFVLDWSGSMQHVLKDTVKQLLNLVWFCRKVNIPFEVYAFSNEWFRQCDDAADMPPLNYRSLIHQDDVPNTLAIAGFFNMLNFLSSKTRAKDFERHCKNLYLLASNPGGYTRLMLSGTPLNEALISLYKLIPQFKERHGVEKLNAIILTDGEAQTIPYIIKYENTYGFNHISERCVLRDRKLGTTYNIPGRWSGPTSALLKNLGDRFPEVNILGIRILGGSELRRYLSNQELQYNEVEKVMTQWKKNKSATIAGIQGYTKYFAMSSSSLGNDSEFQVADNATKSQIKTAFSKSLQSKKLNKKILSEFVEVIA
jgi:hypothetical protein